MQSTLDIELSNARFRDQTAKQTRTRKNLNKAQQIAQLKIQNQLNSKHDQIRFKFVISQNRSFFMQKVEICIQKQSALRHHLSQYIVDEKYVKNSINYIDFNYQKLSDSTLRSIYDVFMLDNISVFNQHLYMTYEKQIEQ